MDATDNQKQNTLRRPLSSILTLLALPIMILLMNILFLTIPSFGPNKGKINWQATLFATALTDLMLIVICVPIFVGSSITNVNRMIIYATNGDWPRIILFFTKGFPLLPSINSHPVTMVLRERAVANGHGGNSSEYDSYFQTSPDGGMRLSQEGAIKMTRHLERDVAKVGFLKRCGACTAFTLKYLPYMMGIAIALKVLAFLITFLTDNFHFKK